MHWKCTVLYTRTAVLRECSSSRRCLSPLFSLTLSVPLLSFVLLLSASLEAFEGDGAESGMQSICTVQCRPNVCARFSCVHQYERIARRTHIVRLALARRRGSAEQLSSSVLFSSLLFSITCEWERRGCDALRSTKGIRIQFDIPITRAVNPWHLAAAGSSAAAAAHLSAIGDPLASRSGRPDSSCSRQMQCDGCRRRTLLRCTVLYFPRGGAHSTLPLSSSLLGAAHNYLHYVSAWRRCNWAINAAAALMQRQHRGITAPHHITSLERTHTHRDKWNANPWIQSRRMMPKCRKHRSLHCTWSARKEHLMNSWIWSVAASLCFVKSTQKRVALVRAKVIARLPLAEYFTFTVSLLGLQALGLGAPA